MTTDDVAIETERLILRSWRRQDRRPFMRYTNTPRVMRWLGGVKSAADMHDVIDRLERWEAQRGFTFWIVERKSDGAVLGFCGLKIADTEGSPIEGQLEVGWRLREDAWGQGYAKEAAAASLDFAFDRLGADEVVAITFARNEASWGLMRRLGMRRRPELDYEEDRFPAELNPAIVYSIARAEWIGCS